MNRAESLKLLEWVKANQRKLEACPKHDFQSIEDPRRMLLSRRRCTNCGGEVDPLCAYWYETGLQHGNS
jgi:hypothetical protein